MEWPGAPYISRAMSRKEIRSDWTIRNTTSQTTAARIEVMVNFSASRGWSGALSAWPGFGFSGRCAPQGSTTNSTMNQATK